MGNRKSKLDSNWPQLSSEETGSRRCWCLTDTYMTKNDVPLKSVSVNITIEGFIANVESTLIYENVSNDPIEVEYVFPIDDQSTVYRFEAQIEDRVIVAECQEKKQAKRTYDDAVKNYYAAVLMREDASDIFSCLVGNLPPNAEAVNKFGYVTELSLQPDGALTFLLPTTLNPRYGPSFDCDSDESGSSVNPPDVSYLKKGEDLPYTLVVEATIINPGRIASVKALNDELNVTFNDNKTQAEVTLAKPFVANHDFTLDVCFEEATKPHIIIGKGDDSKDGILKKDVIMLNFIPELRDADYTNKQEFIFVIDRSGSMQRSRIEMAKETLMLFLKSLPHGSCFNVIGFGSEFEVLFPNGSREYSEDALNEATDHLHTMDANLGGTEILQPLQYIYEKKALSTHNRQILLFTDGEVFNTSEVIDLVRKNANNTRLFSFGIGEGASTSLIRGVARAGRGRAEFTREGDRLQSLVVKTLKSAMQLPCADLHLDWQLRGGSFGVIQLPRELPPLFDAEKLIIYAMTLSDKAMLEGKVLLKGKIGERSLEFGLDVDVAKNITTIGDALPIHRLAAKAQIKQLQDSGAVKNKAKIVLLSTAANVISCHTSMVGIDKNRREKITGDLVRKTVPRSMSRSMRAEFTLEDLESTSDSTYMVVLTLQKFSGEWKLDQDFANVLKTPVDELERAAPVKAHNVWATAVALSYLDVMFGDRRNEWEMVGTKARQWLDLQDCEGHTVNDVLTKARAFVDRTQCAIQQALTNHQSEEDHGN